MKDLIGQIASAIATEEGFFKAGSLPSLNNNPGDLRNAPWLVHPVVVKGFWQAPKREIGVAGLYHQIALDISRGMSLKELIFSWAPPSENRTADYLKAVAERIGISDVNAPLMNFLELSPLG